MSVSENSNEESEIEIPDSRVYELGYLLVPTIAEGNVPAVYGDLKELITATFSGAIVSDEMPKLITLAYEMQKVVSNVKSKFNTAYFGWIKFTMDRAQIVELKKRVDLDPNVIRFIILKTVKENTIAAKRFIPRVITKKPFVVKRDEEEKVLTPVDKERIDKEIDALIEA